VEVLVAAFFISGSFLVEIAAKYRDSVLDSEGCRKTFKLLPILLQGFKSGMTAGLLGMAAAFVSVVQQDAAMAEFSL